MELVEDFDTLCRKILNKYDSDECITVGILVADYRQTECREYIINYLNRFDELSGKYIDFYLPGYYLYTGDGKTDWPKGNHYNMCISKHRSSQTEIYLDRMKSPVYFDYYLFEDFLRELEKRTHITYRYCPMLILVEVSQEKFRGQLEFQRKMVIDLDDGTDNGVKRAGNLFDAIFEFAKKEVHLDRFRKGLRMRYIKGHAIHNMIKILDGERFEVVEDIAYGIIEYRLK